LVRSTAKANKLDLYGYLRRLFYSIPGARSVEHFERLLPFQQPVTPRKHPATAGPDYARGRTGPALEQRAAAFRMSPEKAGVQDDDGCDGVLLIIQVRQRIHHLLMAYPLEKSVRTT
jgi:IS66 C-terminal element